MQMMIFTLKMFLSTTLTLTNQKVEYSHLKAMHLYSKCTNVCGFSPWT